MEPRHWHYFNRIILWPLKCKTSGRCTKSEARLLVYFLFVTHVKSMLLCSFIAREVVMDEEQPNISNTAELIFASFGLFFEGMSSSEASPLIALDLITTVWHSFVYFGGFGVVIVVMMTIRIVTKWPAVAGSFWIWQLHHFNKFTFIFMVPIHTKHTVSVDAMVREPCFNNGAQRCKSAIDSLPCDVWWCRAHPQLSKQALLLRFNLTI